ncbi:AI-2E family transporter [Novosphingobium acidiphilum]|uniref:AI-2E family transporter n=1 Tax=Novosphingobium acidiphilum TaxID=505248 RepID=UPI00040EA5D9|nr:AI-2E family transporter [Novosphingobium acidiphilum]
MTAPAAMPSPVPDAPFPPAGIDSPPGAIADEVLRRQQVRLQSMIVLLLMAGLVLALPFILTLGAVVVQPPVTALVLSIVLSPLADRLTRIGIPNTLASFMAILVMIGIIIVALAVILQPAFDMVDQVPAMAREIARRFAQLRENFAWIGEFNRQINRLSGPLAGQQTRVVALAEPSVIEQLALATPSVLLETLLTILMTFFMIESRIRMRRRLLVERANFTSSVRIARVMRDVQDRVASYILTVAQINAGIGLIVYAGARYYGFTAPVMWGGLAFVLNFLPYMGPLTMVGLLALVGLGTASTVPVGLIPALSFLALHAVEANLVTPTILGARFTLNPVSILISFSFFTWVWGVLGALLSVPILLTLSALVDHLGRPNLVGFLFGESLFEPGRLREVADDDAQP